MTVVNFVKVKRKDFKLFGFGSVHKTPSTVVFVAALMFSGLYIASAAPTSCENDNEWWRNPCTRPSQIRHGRSPTKRQFQTFIEKIDDPILTQLKTLYPYNFANKTGLHKPKGNCILKVGKLMKPIRSTQNFTEAKLYFYATMEKIAQYLNKLKCVSPNTHVKFAQNKRRNIFDTAKDNLRLVMCEYNELLDIQSESYLPKVKIATKCLDEEMDLVSLQLRDIDFFKKLKKFFNQSFTKLKKLQKGRRGRKHKKNKTNKQ